MEGMFGSRILESYLVVALALMVVAAYIILAGIGLETSMEFMVLNILVLILIGANIVTAIIQLRILEEHQNE